MTNLDFCVIILLLDIDIYNKYNKYINTNNKDKEIKHLYKTLQEAMSYITELFLLKSSVCP